MENIRKEISSRAEKHRIYSGIGLDVLGILHEGLSFLKFVEWTARIKKIIKIDYDNRNR